MFKHFAVLMFGHVNVFVTGSMSFAGHADQTLGRDWR
jgi:hypothetical protein